MLDNLPQWAYYFLAVVIIVVGFGGALAFARLIDNPPVHHGQALYFEPQEDEDDTDSE